MVRQWFNRLRMTAALLSGLWLTACVSTPQSAQLLQQASTSPFATPVNLDHIPFFPQEDYQCGPAALATVLQASAVNVTPDELVPRVYVPARQGSLQIEMLAAARAFDRLSYLLSPDLESILQEVRAGRPVLVMQNLALSWYPQWHYAVVVGYDLSKQELLLRSGTTKDYRISLRVFERTWQRSEHWAFVVLRPGELPTNADELRYFESVVAMARLQSGESVEISFQAGLQNWPTSQMFSMGLGNHYYAQERWDDALNTYQRLIAAHPDYAIAHNNLAQVYLQKGNRESAVQHARRAVELGGNFSEMYQNTLQQAQSL